MRQICCSLIVALFGAAVAQASTVPQATLISTWVEVNSENPLQDSATFAVKFRLDNCDQDDNVYVVRYPPRDAVNFRRYGVEFPSSSFIFVDNLDPTGFCIYPEESGHFTVYAFLAPQSSGIYSFELNYLLWSSTLGGPSNTLEFGDSFHTNVVALRGTPEPATILLLGLALPLLRRRQ